MKRLAGFAGLALTILFSHQALAAELFLTVFLDKAPLKGATVVLDDNNLGSTNRFGGISVSLAPGSHTVKLIDDNIAFPIDFSSAAGEDVEIEVDFTTATGDTPVVNIRKFGEDEAGGEGFVTGTVSNTENAPVSGATVTVVGTDYSATTNASGIYELKVPRGEYSVAVSAPGFQSATLPGVRVKADLGVNASATLLAEGAAAPAAAPGSAALEEVFVVGVFNPQDNAASVERYATSITNAIDAAQLERFGDSDVGAALNRVVGVQVVDRKYATVRGLDGRYISSTLNGLLMPSTDTQRREVELDLFPTVIVGGIEIQKSYSPERLASTTGGAIMINTKGLPEEREFTISGDLGFNPDTTFSDILSYRSSTGDWAGYDSGLRNLSDYLLNNTDQGQSLTVCDPTIDPRCTSPTEAAKLGVLLQDDLRVGDKTALPDAEVSLSYGDRLPYEGNEWGYYVAADIDRTTVDRGHAQLSDPLDISGEYERSTETTAVTAYGTVGYEYGAANEILAKTIFLRNTDDVTRVESGFDNQEDNQQDIYLLDYIERQFFSQAFTGSNEFELPWGEHVLDWRGSYSRTERDEPDRRTYTYFNNQLSSSAFERRWSKLDESSWDFGADYAFTFEWGDLSSTQLKFGAMYSDKERNFDQYRYGFGVTQFGSDLDLNIDNPIENVLSYNNYAIGKVLLRANTTDTDSYDSDEKVEAFYANTTTELGEAWTVELGARFEKFQQDIKYPNRPVADNDLDYDDWYPAINTTWRATEELQFRVGYSETVSYPGIIERSEAQTFDPDTDDPIFGNPDLDVATIDNYDVRGEYYFSDTESVSLAVFYKDISNPVERAVPDASGSAAADGITFINQDSATLTGVELDGTKNVWEENDWLVFVGGNVAWIDSKVDLSENSRRLEGDNANNRELQGQSEWLGNLQVGYDHFPTEQKFTLLFNYFDKRIFRVARGENTGPEYEDGRLVMDFTYEKLWNENLTIEGSIKNILNSDVEYTQNGNTIEKYNVGRLFKIGVSYTF